MKSDDLPRNKLTSKSQFPMFKMKFIISTWTNTWFSEKKSSEHVLKPRPSSTMFNHQLLNSCKFFQLSKVLVTQASVLTFKYQCDVVYSTFKKPKSGIWLLELFSRFWEGLFKAYFINSRSIIYRLNGEIRFQFIKVKNLFLFISKKWHVDRWLMYGKSKKYLN